MANRPPTPLETPCRVWRGGCTSAGYGYRSKMTARGEEAAIHRWVWAQVHGPIPKGVCILHRCDNPPCFRYDHLFAGTKGQNNTDRKLKGRNRDQRGERNPYARLTWAEVVAIRALLAAGTHQRVIARQFGVTQSMVSVIHSNKNWII